MYMHRFSFGIGDLSLTLGILACGLLVFCPTLSASNALFVLGSGSGSQYYAPVGQGTVPAGPYPGTLTDTDTNSTSSIALFFCLTGGLNSYWGQSYNGTEAPPSGQAQEEAAFLASLALYDAAQYGITLNTSASGGLEYLSESGPNLANFVSTVEGPISLAIWQIMGSLPTQDGINSNDPAAAPFVALAEEAWTNLLSKPNNSLVQTFDSNVMIFVPSGSTQSFVAAFRDDALIQAAVPEPGTMVLFGAGVLLIAIGRTRRLARRR